jgi:hypothetical protein
MTKTQSGRKACMIANAKALDLHVGEWSPGDGVTRFRFFAKPGNSYFGPDNGMYTACGIAEAESFLSGYTAGHPDREGR